MGVIFPLLNGELIVKAPWLVSRFSL